MKNAHPFRFCVAALLCVAVLEQGGAQPVRDSTTHLFNVDTVAKNLGFPWEILHGPDDSLWITEARGYRVVRIGSGRSQAQKNIPPQQVLKLHLGTETNFTRSVNRWPQGGMQGLALHPEFMTDPAKRWVYLSYVYKQESCPNGSNGANPNGFACVFRSKIVRCRFYFAADAGNPSLRTPKRDSLVILDTLLSNLPGSNDHNSGRLTVSPFKEIIPGVDTQYRLYYTIGDMGAGQFNNDQRTVYAQNRDTLEGKTLRLNTEPDDDAVPPAPRHDFEKWRRWIPNDNPFTHSVFTAVHTPVYSYGHRNPQGLAWGYAGGAWRLYSSEHGDKSDDEANVLVAGGNYGWPRVAGLADNNYSNSDASTTNNVLAGQTVSWSESAWAAANNMERPLFSFFNAAAGAVPANGTDIFTWPTIAPSSIDFYGGNIPGWKNSLLVSSLKYGLFRLKLNAAGSFVDSTVNTTNLVDTFPLLHGWRVRDLAISPYAGSGVLWVVIDSLGSTSGPTGGFSGGSSATRDGGSVLRLSYKWPWLLLPVRFVRFDAALQAETVALRWRLAGADRPLWCAVERSADGQHFERIGAAPPGTETFTDAQPLAGHNHYRIAATDGSGHRLHSAVQTVAYRPAGFALRLYPNPVRDALTVRVDAKTGGTVLLQVCDVAGRCLHRQTLHLRGGVQSLRLDVSGWPAQVYEVKLTGTDGSLYGRHSFVKQ